MSSGYGQHPLDDLMQVEGWDVALCGCGKESPPSPDPAVAASFWAAHASDAGHWNRPKRGPDLLDPVKEWVWCVDCYEAHAADLERGVLLDQSPDDLGTCAANGFKIVEELPEDWENKYYAIETMIGSSRGKRGYRLYEREPAIQPDMHCIIRPEVIQT